jgi:hypothetical protein
MKKFFVYLFIGVMALAIAPQGALATALPIVNPSFETDTPDPNTWVYWPDANTPRRLDGQITGWTVSENLLQGVHRFTTEYNSIPYGPNVAYVTDGLISQVLENNPVISGHIYTLSAYVGLRNNYVRPNRHPSYFMELWAGDTLLERVDGQIPAAEAGYFYLKELVYTATNADVGLLAIKLGSIGGQTNFDLVSLNNATPAPIPGSVALMLTGLMGMSALGLRFRKN